MSGTKNEISTCSLTGDEYASTASVKFSSLNRLSHICGF